MVGGAVEELAEETVFVPLCAMDSLRGQEAEAGEAQRQADDTPDSYGRVVHQPNVVGEPAFGQGYQPLFSARGFTNQRKWAAHFRC